MTSIKKLFNKLLGKQELEQVGINEDSQGHVLATRMVQTGIKHDQKVLVDLDEVRIVDDAIIKNGKAQRAPMMRFCPTHQITVHETLSEGDDNIINDSLNLKGIKIPKGVEGSFTLKNVILHANGKLNVIATEKTELVRIK